MGNTIGKRGIVGLLAAMLAVMAFAIALMPVPQAHAQVNVGNPRIADGVVTWDCVTFGSYAQSDATGGTKEPIKWRVLKVEDGKALLLADKNLDCRKYNDSWTSVTWEECTLRTWLNEDFLDAAFTDREKEEDILTTTVENPNNPDPRYPTPGGNATQDKVFLLSIQEAKDGAYGFPTDQARQAVNTAYAENQGAYTSYGNGYWWLRSPGWDTDSAAVVWTGGSVQGNGKAVRASDVAVRPALWVDLDSPDLVDAGTVSCPSYTVTFDVRGHGTAPAQQTVEHGNKVTKPQDPVAEGLEFGGWYRDAECKTAWDFANDTVTSYTTLYAKWTAVIPMHRLYNPYSGEHFYTADDAEKDGLVAVGWAYEGIGWNAPATGDPVYRLYNRFGGEHHYTLNAAEKDALVGAGWEDEGIGWHSDVNKTVPVYREYNPFAFSNNHNYTTSLEEHNMLVSVGWKDEGIAWYGV